MATDSPNPRTFCPVHETVQRDIETIKSKQDGRPCQGHDERIKSLGKSEERMSRDNNDQWDAINSLRKMVYMGAGAAGVLAFLGSIIGGYLKGR
ncbi:hypothetical protein D4S03_11965 [bacterium]|nr:MAG: hypothetical protein D4S03_11965 [bacterium]